jgi:membrane associated rhomboid family serine protease
MSLALVSFLVGGGEEPFNEAYYATAAQVIPLLLATAVATRIWSEHKDVPVERNLISILVVIFAVAGEYVAFSALSSRETPSHYEDVAIGMSIALSGGLVALNLLAEPVKAIGSRIPERHHGLVGNGLVIIYFLCVAVIAKFRPDPSVVITAAAFAVAIGFILLGIWRDNEGWIKRWRRRDN